jgi:hypothetical protein
MMKLTSVEQGFCSPEKIGSSLEFRGVAPEELLYAPAWQSEQAEAPACDKEQY